MNYAKDAPQTRLTQEAAENLRTTCSPLFVTAVSVSR